MTLVLGEPHPCPHCPLNGDRIPAYTTELPAFPPVWLCANSPAAHNPRLCES